MAIKYRIVERQNALTKTLQYYAQVEPVEPLTLQDIVEGIEKTSTVSSADIKAVLDALQFEVIRALKGGQSVRLGDLGSFRPTLTSRSALSAEAFTRDNLKGVRAVQELMPGLPQVGVFDTAFHQTMPDYAYMYAIPYELYEKYGIRRYGFHGTSHRYVSQRVCDFLGVKAEEQRVITCHIGNGGSVAAVKHGKCMDTSMGLTPLEGVMMGTRSGDIDGGAVSFIEKKLGLDADGISNLLNKKSGVLGITGISSDMREIEAAEKAGNPRAILAQNMYNYRIKKYIGAYAAAMGGVDIIVFTAGVGENQSGMRAGACEGLEWMGVKLDKELNLKVHGEEAVISAPDSKVKVVVIPTDEELMIATDTMNLL